MIEIDVPSGVHVGVEGQRVTTKGPLGSNERAFNSTLLSVSVSGQKVTVKANEGKKIASKAAMAEKAFAKQVRNDMEGVQKYYERSMQVVFAHFPASVEVAGKSVKIKNLIGERFPRESMINGSTKVEVKGNAVRLYGTKLEDVTQTAANIVKACKIRKLDSRVFQDGVYYAIEG